MPLHSLASGTDLHEAKREKAPVRAASTTNVTLATPGSTLDVVTLVANDRILLKNQTAPAENGIYVWTGAAVALTRATDADSASDFEYGFKVFVREGTVNATLHYVYTQSGAVTLGSTSLTFASLAASGATGATGATGPQGIQGASGSNGTPGVILVSGAPPYICIQDQKTSGTAGGGFTSGADRTRDLNTFIANDLNLAVLAANQVTLPAGTYRCHITAPAYNTSTHQALLFNITASATVLRGTTEVSRNGAPGTSRSIIVGRVLVAQSTTFEVRHRCTTTEGTDGFGLAGSFGTEVYTQVEFWLEAGPPPFLGSTFENPNLDKIPARRFDAMTSIMDIGQQSNCLLPF